MSEPKSPGKQLEEKLFYDKKNAYKVMDEQAVSDCYAFCDGYKDFLGAAVTERLSISFMKNEAAKKGYLPFDCKIAALKAGDTYYQINRDKTLILLKVGKKPLSEGLNVVVSHIDSPRIDLKPNPVYEKDDFALFKTHYYGGIKKYQWTALPLSLYGVVYKKDGTKIDVAVGDRPGDPVFTITDLLPHLAAEQMGKKLSVGIEGEQLNILIGSVPFADDDASKKIKLNILNILNKTYGITEEDFLSSELCCVPCLPPRDIGFDKSLLGAYGHDDRVCAYTSFMGMLQSDIPEHTSLCVFADKEEVGSMGSTGMQSRFFENFVYDLCEIEKVPARHVLSASHCLSADVNVSADPTFDQVLEKNNASKAGFGVAITKYTGSRGKASSSDAEPSFIAALRGLFDKNNVLWQTGELGKVDQGGGGTVAQFVANLDVTTVDCGVPVLSMHSPFEVVSKADVYMAYLAFKTFYNQF